jgi:biopolymer transport protein ExbB
MWNYFVKGGPVMWPLLLSSILGVTVIIWRWVVLRQATRGIPAFMSKLRGALAAHDIPAAIQACEAHPGPVASLVKAALLRLGRPKDEIERTLQDVSAQELAMLERGLPVLATVATVAPLLGFLGTVTGMINSFEALASVGLNNPAAVAQGISEALITTAAGLMIAIPVQMAHNYFVSRINDLVRSMEGAANAVLETVGETVRDARPARAAVELPLAAATQG